MTEEERMGLLNEYTELLNSCETTRQVKRSQKLKDFEAKHGGDEELKKLMKSAKCMRILFIEG
jgi:hypothetical protein